MRLCVPLCILALLIAAAILTYAPAPAHATLKSGENAIDILGQFSNWYSDTTPDYTKGCANNGASQIAFNDPSGLAIDATNHWLFAADSENNRVLVFPLNSSNQLASKTASYVLGQADFISCNADGATGITNQSGISTADSGYESVAVDPADQRLFVADTSNNRVLVFSTASMSDGENASYVLGASTSTTNTGGVTTKSGMNGPTGLAYDASDNWLFVDDYNNSRVLVFNVAPGSIASGENASYVLGASNFTTNTGGVTTKSGMNAPAGAAYDAADKWLFVGDQNNSRVLVFNVASGTIANGENASYVLGQPNFTTGGTNLTQSGLSYVIDVAYDPNDHWLFVGDQGNNRVMVFNVASGTIANGENASYVLGAPDFTSDGSGDGQSGFYPNNLGYAATNSLLYVADYGNNRVMIFNVTPPATFTPTVASQGGAQGDACGIGSGALFCWGYNLDGEDGVGTTTQYLTPQQVGGDTTWTAIYMESIADWNACGIDNGQLYCWGSNANGELGLGSGALGNDYATPQLVSLPSGVTSWTAVSGEGTDTCAIANTGGLYCWGINTHGEDGVGNTTQHTTPQQVGSATNWIAVSVGVYDTCGIRGSGTSGALYCWGYNEYGEDGTGPVSNLAFVTSTTATYTGDFGSSAANAITAANADCAARATAGGLSGTFDAWIGDSSNNPSGEFVHSTSPYVEPYSGTVIASNWTGLTSGTLTSAITQTELSGTTLASGDAWTNVATNGTVEHSGSSAADNCAAWSNGTTDTGYYGVIGSATSTWTYASGDTATCSTAGHLYCFQQNANPAQQTTPVQVGTDTTWSAISQGSYDTCGIDNGKLYCWGENAYGELGLNNTTQYNSPQQVGTDTTWTAISVQYDGGDQAAACGVDNGNLYCWGQDADGELGLGGTTAYKTPQHVVGLTNWTAVSYSADDTCGIAGGTLYCWGKNNYGEDGVGTTTQNNSPVAVTFLTLNGENATDELGQYTTPLGFTDSWTGWGANNGFTALGFSAPSGIALDPLHHYLFVTDADNARVLVYTLNTDNSFPSSSGGHTASYELGCTDFKGSDCGGDTQSTLNFPLGLADDPTNQLLYVADYGNNRVMVFSTASLANGENASYVLGCTDFTGDNCTNGDANTLSWGVDGLALDTANQRLFVTDASGSRIMVFNVAPGTLVNGENAAYELGCTDLNYDGCYGTTQSTFGYAPADVTYDPVYQRLFVADSDNNRVLVFNVAPGTLTNGENASYVLGQTSFTANGNGTTQSTMNFPAGLSYDPNHAVLFVSDWGNNRVLAFDVLPAHIANGENASWVLGQSSFTTRTAATAQSGFSLGDDSNPWPWPGGGGLCYNPGNSHLFISDYSNNRVMIFDGGTLANFFKMLPD